MKITITGSLGNIGKPLTQTLANAGHEVTVITSQSDRKPDIEALGALSAVGSVTDAIFLTAAFQNADAVYTMTPPNLGGGNVIANTAAAGKAFATAITASGVKRVVMLSSVGADLSKGNGPIAGLHQIEELYKNLNGVSVTFLRAGYFYINVFNDIPLIKEMGIIGANYPGNVEIPWVHPRDIAQAVAEELVATREGKNVRYIVSDIRAASEMATTIGEVIGKPGLPWIEFTDEQSFQGMTQAGLVAEISGLYTEMGAGFRAGLIPRNFHLLGSPVTGNVKLEEFAEEFKIVFNR